MSRKLRVFRYPIFYANQKCQESIKIHDIYLVKKVQYACKWNFLNSEDQVIPDIYGKSKKKEIGFNLYIPMFHIVGHVQYNDPGSQLLKDAVRSRKKDMEYFL